ncbi:hypothetical protein [Planococcus lenghuensis]|uniref:Uncharacterized protein n=1 Tax=Planococcus lenghuensis TaxID=2213202 RepID=A0A1Q2KZ51_9BACL|nr:hypothetical protein [Planococcus lenghuensis]AQQ53479.1 hypothetical protein B0X71_10605 [Planococcus lenghuensis]
MHKNQPAIEEEINFYFTQVKDTHRENGQQFITLFARLTVENSVDVTSVWVEIDEVKWEQAPEKLKSAPNGMVTYLIPESVFMGLMKLSKTRHAELYSLTPMYKARKFKRFE